jgi:glycosyltransferase involved in cell wall biosynthesis
MKRLLFVVDGLGTGGKERQVVELLKGLSKYGKYEIELVCTESDDFYLPDVEKLGIPVRFLTRRFRWDPFLIFHFFSLVRKFDPQIIHTYGVVPTFFAIPVARLLNIPLVNGSIRNSFASGNYRWKLEKLLLNFSDVVVANSRTGLASRGLQESKKNIVIYNGFDFPRIEQSVSGQKSMYSPPVNKKIVGMVAAFSDYKDQPTFIRAALKILSKRTDTRFVLVGNGKNFGDCKRMIQHVPSGIEFLGLRKDIESIITTFTVGVLATFTEGISNSIMEYMAAGKPVVATDGGATREIVIDGKTGFLTTCGDYDTMAEKIEILLDNKVLSKKMGDLGKERLKKEFSLDNLINNTLALYDTIQGH